MSKQTIRVLMVSFLIPPYSFAGAGNQAVLLATELLKLGYNVSIVTSGGNQGWVMQDTLQNLPVFRLRGSRNKLLTMILFQLFSMVWWALNARQYDIVHIHGCTNLTTLLWIPLARLWRRKSLLKITCTGVDDLASLKRFPFIGRLAHTIACRADGYIALTPQIEAQLLEDVPHQRVFLITNGYNSSLFFPVTPEEKRHLRRQLDLPVEGNLLVYTGGINPRKNIHFLIESLVHIRGQYPQTVLCLVGPCKDKFQSYHMQVQERITSLGLNDAVIWRDTVSYPEVPAYLQTSDVFVFASIQEGLPSSPIEAMACGLPSVVQALEGVTDWLYQESDIASITEPHPEAFAAAIMALLADPEGRAHLAGRIANYAQKRFEAHAVAQIYDEQIYPALLGTAMPQKLIRS